MRERINQKIWQEYYKTSLWIAPDGNIQELPPDTHDLFIGMRFGKSMDEMQEMGWLRCSFYKDRLLINILNRNQLNGKVLDSIEKYAEKLFTQTDKKGTLEAGIGQRNSQIRITVPVNELFDGDFKENLLREIGRGLMIQRGS